MISDKCTICPPKYDGSIISQYKCIQFMCRGNRGRKLEWGCCKLVATGYVSDTVFQFSCDTFIYPKDP